MAQQVPKIRAVPITQDPNLAGFLQDIKKAVESLSSATPPPQPVSNLSATPVAGGCVIQFTRSNATNFRVYSASSNDRSKATITDLGNNNKWVDTVGSGGVLRFYWVEALSPTSGPPSPLSGPVSATTLALGASATVTPPADPSYGQVYDATLGTTRPVVYGTDFIAPGKQAS